jgi:hypothetical protein
MRFDDDQVAECLRKTALEVLPLANGISEVVLGRILEKVPALAPQHTPEESSPCWRSASRPT